VLVAFRNVNPVAEAVLIRRLPVLVAFKNVRPVVEAIPDTFNEESVAEVPLTVLNWMLPVEVALRNVRPVVDAIPDTSNEESVAEVPDAVVNLNVVIVALLRLTALPEAVPAKNRVPVADTLNLDEEFVWKLMKSPLKVALLNPIMVPDAEPPLICAPLPRKNKELVAD